MNTVKLLVIADASFANARNMRSQLGFVILRTDVNGRENIINYESNRCRRVMRSVMASEVHDLVLGSYFAVFFIRDLLTEILGKVVPLEALVDSKTAFDIVTKDGKITKRRMKIDICALIEPYTRG